jgi:peptidyl-prolyl cis-trans isomerase D
MSVLGKIREKSSLLLIIIGGALVAFVLGDLLSSGGAFFTGDQNRIGEIAGQTISPQEFEMRILKAEENYKMNTGASSVDESTREMLRQQVWNQLVNEIIMTEEYQEIGIRVSSQELYDMVAGTNPHPTVRQAFTDPQTGVFEHGRVLNFLRQMDQDPTGDTKMRWLEFEKNIKQEKKNEKYNTLIKQGLYVPAHLSKHEYFARNKNVKLQFVAKRYNSIADEDVSFTETDLKKYHSENSKDFEQEESRKIEYAIFDIQPSNEDILLAQEAINRLYNEFVQSDDDTSFVRLNTDGEFRIEYLGNDQLSPETEVLFNAPKGNVTEPYREGNTFKLAKLVDSKMIPDSAKARHILVNIQEGDTASAMAKIDSLKRLIKGGKKFAEIAEKNSEDFGSATKGGDLGWFTEGVMVKPFNDAVFHGKKGDMPIVVSQFGVHLIEITDKSAETKKALIAFVEREIEPSSATYQQFYIQASEFSNRNRTLEAFDNAAAEAGITKRIADNVKPGDRMIPGLENSREIIRWVYKAKEGEVSKPFEVENKFIVVALKETREEGVAPLERVRGDVERAVIREKKAEKFISEFNAIIPSSKDISEIATKTQATAEVVESLNFAAYSVPGIGREPKVLGAVFAIPKGSTSSPIKGETGVFVVQVDEVVEPAAITDYSFFKNQLSTNLTNRVAYEVFEALKDNANITDNRFKFY